MPDFLRTLLASAGFIPHGHCYLWKPDLVWLHVSSDALIALAYYSISFMLVYFVYKRRDVPFNWIFLLFGSFIIACGTTHLMEIWTLWHPTYWLAGWIKAFTAIVSLGTAVLLSELIPKALVLPSPAELEAVNLALRNEILERQQVEEALRESERRFRAIFNQTFQFIGLLKPDGTVLEINQTALEFVGIKAADIVGRPFWDEVWNLPTEFLNQWKAAITEAANGNFVRFEGNLPTPQGTMFVDASLKPVKDETGQVVLLIPEGREITERKRAEEALQRAYDELEIRVRERTAELTTINASLAAEIAERKQAQAALHQREQELKALIENTPDIIARFDRDLRHIYVNSAIELATGVPSEVFIGKTNRELGMSEDLVSQWESIFRQVFETGQENVVEFQFPTPNGLKYYQSRLVAEFTEDGLINSVLGISRDITGLKQVEEALRNSEQRFRATFNQAAVGIAEVERNGQWRLVNQKLCDITGYTREELLERTFQDITHPDDLNTDLENVGRMLAGEISTYSMEKRYIRKDTSPVWINLTGSVVRNCAGELRYFIAIVEDISDRKRFQQEITQLNQDLERRVVERTAQLEAANRELEAFSYSVSHDLRAPLRSVDGFSQALLERYADTLDEKGKHYLHRIRAGSQRMGELIDDLLELSRVTRTEMRTTEVDLSAIASEIVIELRQSQPERPVEVAIAPGILAQGDARLLRIILENLLHNAWKFTSNRLYACIEFGIILQTDSQPAYFVRDNGAGFDMAYANKLFGAFQRLHSMTEFPGTGIGLATVQRIVHRHGGRVWAESAVEQGATFYFTL
ncbi:PAS domain S-box protein [Coleofasciculus sp. FACHB-129]|uniref:PAS domain-containing sensor histidine kinase n=1 Tax=Cyanophyceae TaxID=3028117 RepID=UPI0016850D27|nr:PAS domain S-box protein [Coleofasciculus sp. FACHB-129]MBD1893594.1 PAS domain S-box protein [Coleofasciculus sp. FACHB-129]